MNTQKMRKKYEIDTTTQKKTEERQSQKKKKRKKKKRKEKWRNQKLTIDYQEKEKGKERRNIPLKKCSTNWKKKIAGAESEWSQK